MSGNFHIADCHHMNTAAASCVATYTFIYIYFVYMCVTGGMCETSGFFLMLNYTDIT